MLVLPNKTNSRENQMKFTEVVLRDSDQRDPNRSDEVRHWLLNFSKIN